MVSSKILSQFVLETLRLSSAFAAHADEMVADIGLTSARWQVVGAIMASHSAQPVAHLARDMCLSRQGVQRIVNELFKDGMVSFEPNPHHARAHLVKLTALGANAFNRAIERQDGWIKSVGNALDDSRLTTAINIMSDVRGLVENKSASSAQPDSALFSVTKKISAQAPEK